MIAELIGGPAYAVGATALRQWKFVAIGGLAIFGGVQTIRLSHARHVLAIEQASHLHDIDTWRTAGIQATLNATAAARSKEAAQTKISEDMTNDYQKRLSAFRSALAGRLRPASTTNLGSGGGANLPSLSYDTGVYLGPGADRGISQADAATCGEVTLRLIQARETVLGWKAAAQTSLGDTP